MYPNLKLEMDIHNVTIENIAKTLELHRNSVSNKLNSGSFSVEEAFKVRDTHFPHSDMQYLYKRTNARAERLVAEEGA